MSNVDLLTSTPNPNYVSLVAAFIRWGIQIGAGAGFLASANADSQITMIAAALVSVATLCWSLWQKLQAEKKKHDAAVQSARQSAEASAAAGAPVPIAVIANQPKRLP